MELDRALRTTASIRSFHGDPVPDVVVYRIFASALIAGSGGNRQGWRVLVVKAAAIRRRIRELYVSIFGEPRD